VSYSPQPGTVAHRAVEHIKRLPPGTEIPNAVLAEALDQPAATLPSFLKTCRDKGLLIGRRCAQGRLHWRLAQDPAEAAAASAAFTVPDEKGDAPQHAPVRLVVQQWPPISVLPSPEAHAELNAEARACLDEMPLGEPAPQRERVLVKRAWFCSDGQLVIESAEHEFLFDRLEARQFLRAARKLGEAFA
jgi:hypothetical protein